MAQQQRVRSMLKCSSSIHSIMKSEKVVQNYCAIDFWGFLKSVNYALQCILRF